MIHALDRLRLLATVAVAALLVVTLAVVVFRGFEEGTLTSTDAPSDAAPGDSARSGSSSSPEAADGPEVGEAPGDASDLVLVSQDVVLPSSSSTVPSASASAGTSPRGPSAPASTTPTSSVPATPTTPPTSPPVTPPTAPGPSTPTTPAPPASKLAVVNVGVLSGGQLLSVDVNLGASNLVNLSLLQP